MRRLSSLFFLGIVFPSFLYSQHKSFCSYEDSYGYYKKLDSSIYSDSVFRFSIDKRLASFVSVNDQKKIFSQLYGLGFKGSYKDRISFIGSFDAIGGDYKKLTYNYQDSLGITPEFGKEEIRYHLSFKYKLTNFISIDFGKGRHFIGNGYRSLLLSNTHTPYPYFKIITEFGRIRYYNLYTTFLNPNMNDFGRKKHAAIHFLDFSVSNNISLGFFESILWQSKSENSNKGFEFAYMNPIIFYRPVEFSMHSNKGNALMGTNINVLFYNTNIYAQFLLDDLNISRRKDSDENYESGFFQNKFAFQVGLRTKIKGVDLLLEYNQVQPYTYGHRTILQNYSHMNEALAHPLGANFKEVVLLADYKKDRWGFRLKVTSAQVGLDSLNTHYGQNIFLSDFDASTGGQTSYGNFNGQGVLTNIYSAQSELTYSLKWFDIFGSILFRRNSSDLLDNREEWYSVGIRTFPFLLYTDY